MKESLYMNGLYIMDICRLGVYLKKGLFEHSNDYFMMTEVVDVCHSHETILLIELLFNISNKKLFSYQ